MIFRVRGPASDVEAAWLKSLSRRPNSGYGSKGRSMADESGDPPAAPGQAIGRQTGGTLRTPDADSPRARWMRTAILVVLVVGAPLAYPAWAIERAIKKHRPSFEFGIYTSTPYFLALGVTSVITLITVRVLAVRIVALYVLTIMELISLATCAIIAVIRAGRLQSFMRTVARRSIRPQAVTARPVTIYAATVSVVYAVVYFGALSLVLWQGSASYFAGLSRNSSTVYSFWLFIQNSFLTIINNSGPLDETRFASQVIADVERIIGIFLLVFVLGVLISGWAEQAVRRSPGSSEGSDNN